MKKLLIVLFLSTGCSVLFNADNYNPNPRPIPVPVVEAPKDSVKVDTIQLTNGIDTIKMIIVDTLKWPISIDTLKID